LAAKALDQELNAAATGSGTSPVVINDLTSTVVKKKKKALEPNGSGKRKADDDPGSPSEKKVKLEEKAKS